MARSVSSKTLFEQIGLFLDAQKLSSDPAHYAFAFAVVSAPDSPLARTVAQLTEQGVRLTRHDIERLGGQVVDGPPLEFHPRPESKADTRAETEADKATDSAIALVDETQQQVDGFAKLMRTMQAETHGFGRDLAKALRRSRRWPRSTRSHGSRVR